MTGLRERKKERTRNALIRAAHEMFIDRGYDATTVDDISEAVDVSQRTFFRYFASKEEVAFALQDEIERRFVAAVAARPADEPPARALRYALTDNWDHMGEAIEEVVPSALYMRMWQVIETTPSLVAVHLRRSTEWEDELADLFARRSGVDPAGDARPRVLVAAFVGVMRAAGRQWGCGEDVTVESARRTVEHHLDLLAPALLEDWGRGGERAGERAGEHGPGSGPSPRSEGDDGHRATPAAGRVSAPRR